MPWCPACRQEYRPGIARCADCTVELVEDLARHDRAAAEQAAARLLRIVAPGGTLTALASGLKGRGIPVELEAGGGGLLVPEAAAELVEASLGQVAEYERVGDVLHVYGPRQDLEPEVPLDPGWLEKSDAELVAERDAAIGGLVALFASPVARLRMRAFTRLNGLLAAQQLPIADVLLWTARARMKKALYAFAALLAERPPAGLAARLLDEVKGAEPLLAGQLLHVVALLRDRAAAPALVALLDHESSLVRDDADEALVSLAGFDVGFDAEAEPTQRARAIALWREWLADGARR